MSERRLRKVETYVTPPVAERYAELARARGLTTSATLREHMVAAIAEADGRESAEATG